MILKTAHVTNFKCIKDSTRFSLDKDVTCLVGKNEAGKTAILEALHKLRPVRDEDGKFDVTKEYFRPSVLDYKPVHGANPDTAIRTTWELEDEDRKALEPIIGAAAQKVGSVTVSKRFDDKVLVEFELDEAEVVQALLKGSDLESKEKGKYKAAPTVRDLATQLSAAPEDQPAAQRPGSGNQKAVRREVCSGCGRGCDFGAHSKGCLFQSVPAHAWAARGKPVQGACGREQTDG